MARPSALKVSAFERRETSVPAGTGTVKLTTFTCLPLEEAGFVNAFSTRLGGISRLPENALQLAFKNEEAARVRENRRRFLSAIGTPRYHLVTPEQTHSAYVSVIEKSALPVLQMNEKKELSGDALISDLPRVLAGVKTADCLSILIGDPEKGAFAAVHAGWRGTLSRVLEKTIRVLETRFGSNPLNCLAALGPAACEKCYLVGLDVVEPFRSEFSYANDLFSASNESGKFFFNSRLANAMQLINAGLAPFNIFGSEECNMHQNELFFSHRREGMQDRAGRCLAVIGKK